MKVIGDFLKKIGQEIIELFSENSKASMMRLMSIVMLIVAIKFLFFSYEILFEKETDISWPVVVLLSAQNLLNFGFAFFPKLIQKKFEQINVNKILNKND